MKMIIQILVLVILLMASISDFKRKEIPVFFLGGAGALALLSMVLSIVSGSFTTVDVISLVPGALMILIYRTLKIDALLWRTKEVNF